MRWAFHAWFFTSFIVWNASALWLGKEQLISGVAASVGLLLSPLVIGGCALPFAWLAERRAEERHQRQIQEMERQKREANLRLLILQAQIEPHFLFNTLASLRASLREDVRVAEAMVDALVRHLRAVLPVIRSDADTSTLAEQVSICSSYLELISIRMEGRLSFGIAVPDSMRGIPFPPMVLLTLVENAVKHGIEPRVGAGRIEIEAEHVRTARGRSVVVRVKDDGVGLSTGPRKGVGLCNVREQLAQRYGELGQLSLCSRAGGGVVACIVVPASGS
jgi:sensor histidine kinase YesM